MGRGGTTGDNGEGRQLLAGPLHGPIDVAVVVVSHNSADQLPDCLTALGPALEGIGTWRVLVIDNDSSDDSIAVAERCLAEATLVELGHNAGYAAAINEGVTRCPEAQHVLVLNPDVRLEPGSVRALLDAMERPGVGIAVPTLVEHHGALQHSLRREPTIGRAIVAALVGGRRAAECRSMGEIVGDEHQYLAEHPVDWATGAAMLISRQCLSAVGPWDESFFLYSEETDFCLRAGDAGFLTWYTPTARAVHLGGESNTDPWLWSVLTVNRVRAFRKRHGRVATFMYWLVVLLGETLRALAGGATHRAAARALLRPGLPVPRPEGGSAANTQPGWVCFSAQDWWYHNRAHSDFQLMRRVARERPVLFVNSIGMRIPMPGRSTQVTRRILRKARSVLRFMSQPLVDLPNFHVLTPVIVPFYGSAAMRALNAVLVRVQVRFAAKRAGIDLRDAVILVTIPTAWEVVRPLTRRALLLNRSDLHSAFEETDQDLIRSLETDLLTNSDVVLYTSHSLMDAEDELSGDRATFLDHGVDLDHFGGQVGHVPDDVADLDGPVVGFFGGIDDYVVDLALLQRVAEELPEVTLLLIGDATCPIDGLLALPNVRWLGYRPYEDIPAYGAMFDVALMPWLRNDWIEHSNPIKLKEYLALGLPVVSTDFPEVHHYADVIAIARDHDEFVELVRSSLDGNAVGTEQSRRARVATATWDRRAHELIALGERVRA
jgi:GT2 family glycosyltransferase/glycosyltransferase involved in cell wall biosynthesis